MMEELNARIDEAEVAITRSEHGDWSDWVTNKEMDQNLYAKFPWLQLSTSLTSGTQG